MRRTALLTGTTVFYVGDLTVQTYWSLTLAGADSFVHLSARDHVMQETEIDLLMPILAVNFDGTLHLAREGAAVGVKRFMFFSSLGVNGSQT